MGQGVAYYCPSPGCKFDFPILFVEMLRSGIGLEVFDRGWHFVDTLHVLRALDSDVTGGCVKLQCLVTRWQTYDGLLQAHRALDCRAAYLLEALLKHVMLFSIYRTTALPCVESSII